MKNLTKQLIQDTEEFTGKNTVRNACTTGFMMVEMTSNELAQKVAKVWIEAKKMKIEISNNKVYAF
jgi:hypothetical protein